MNIADNNWYGFYCDRKNNEKTMNKKIIYVYCTKL